VEMCPEKDALKVGFLKSTIVPSTYKRFIKSTAVKVTKGKRSNPVEKD
jgi:hypothetical protein